MICVFFSWDLILWYIFCDVQSVKMYILCIFLPLLLQAPFYVHFNLFLLTFHLILDRNKSSIC